ncbi:MAG: GIY-YIG nuclease family protein [Corynebacterium sp.]|uniref:GIY-YIG nuclease family protein n=1 Tax=Corynebacterium sp. TaxID=1720 RepID=UPI0026E04073|nr:GIY-YIG nuclease family protein [Corynebacterium sp.]MDO5670178.1 GIY-YIG nuclease family protein [Corynebacterium sp.]
MRKDNTLTSSASRRWAVHGLTTINAILAEEECCGIYVLEFDNGEFYVGQARDVRKRFANHCWDTSHHPAWTDITHVSFTPYPRDELHVKEAALIRQFQRDDKKLRNRSLNLYHDQPSPLDAFIPPQDQFHWADSEFLDRETTLVSADELDRTIAKLPPGSSRMTQLPAYEPCLRDIATFVDLVIPDPLSTVEKYWTISDTPSTNGGRYYTINVGVLEMLRCLQDVEVCSVLNTFPWPELENSESGDVYEWAYDGPDSLTVHTWNFTYPKAEVTFVEYETGRLRDVLETDPQVLQSARALAVALMRTGTAGIFRRWHSQELTREALTKLWEERTAKE